MGQMTVHGLALYHEAGTNYQAMYDQAVWWYEAALLGEWIISIAIGAAVYVGLLVTWSRVCKA
jgi:hypothetical protein